MHKWYTGPQASLEALKEGGSEKIPQVEIYYLGWCLNSWVGRKRK